MNTPPFRAVNRAKCALCHAIASSYYATDEAVCYCGEVHVKGGELQAFKPSSGNWSNIIYVDELGNNICVENQDDKSNENPQQNVNYALKEPIEKGRSRKELIDELESMVQLDVQLPNNAHIQQLTYVDLVRYMVVVLDILKRDS